MGKTKSQQQITVNLQPRSPGSAGQLITIYHDETMEKILPAPGAFLLAGIILRDPSQVTLVTRSSLALHGTQFQIQRLHREQDLQEGDGQGGKYQEQTDRKKDLAGQLPARKKKQHADYTAEKTCNPAGLHIPDQHHPMTQTLDLTQQNVIRICPIAVMQVADPGTKGQKAIGIGNKEKGHGREKQGGGGKCDIHGSFELTSGC